jgi:predicted dehydrogenase
MYKVAIIGCGWVGLAHASGYQAIKECRIVGAVDPITSLSENLTGKYGGKAYEAIHELLENEKPAILSICTPPASHLPVIKTALSHGIKYIVCEKPLAHNVANAQEIVAAMKKNKGRLMTAFCHRFVEPVQKIRELFQSGALGDPVFFRNEFSSLFKDVGERWFSKPEVSGGGCIIDTSVHSIDLFRFLCGEVKSVSARLTRRIPGLKVEDSSCLLLQSENGCMGTILASWNAAVGRAVLEVCGTRGRAHYEYWGEFRVRLDSDKDWNTVPVKRDINRRFEDELRHFIRVIKGEVILGPGGEDGLRANEIIEAAYRSVTEKKWIVL